MRHRRDGQSFISSARTIPLAQLYQKQPALAQLYSETHPSEEMTKMSAHVIGAGCWAHQAGRGTWGGLECVGEGQSVSTGVVMRQEEAVAHRDGAGESQGCLSAVGGPWGASNTLVHVSEGRRTWVGLGMREWGLGGIAEGWETVWLVAAAGMWVSTVRCVQVRGAAAAAAPGAVGGHCAP